MCVKLNVCERVCERVPVLLQINLPPCVQKYKCEEPSPFAASEDCLHMLFFNWDMLVLWLLPFKHRCEEPLVHFVRNLLLMINKICQTATPPVWRIRCHTNAICAPLRLSPLYFRQCPCVEGTSLCERWQRWTLLTMEEGHVAERTLHGFCSGFHRPAYWEKQGSKGAFFR